MGKIAASRQSRQNSLSGYRHHSYEKEKYDLRSLLTAKNLEHHLGVQLSTYADVLAPEPFRAMKNAVICLTTIVSRMTIDQGVPAEKSFSISDYYVYEVELQKNKQDLEKLAYQMVGHFRDLVQEQRAMHYSVPVARAIRYIHEHLYEPCRVRDIAAAIQRNPNYFSAIFKKEVGMPPSQYLLHRKVEEAKVLYLQFHYSISELSEMLGFCNPAHFSSEFKKVEGVSPKQFLQDMEDLQETGT